MANVDGSLGGLFGGVSQQPDVLRRPGQCTLQENMFLDWTEGLKRRPKIDAVVAIAESVADPNDVFVHWFEHNNKLHALLITPDDVLVYDEDGASYTVTEHADIRAYFDRNDDGADTFESSALRGVQVGEYNLIANSRVDVQMSDTIPDVDSEIVTFHIKDGMEWGLEFVIAYDGGNIATYTLPAGDTVNATEIAKIRADYIAGQLGASLQAWSSGSTVLAPSLPTWVATAGNVLQVQLVGAANDIAVGHYVYYKSTGLYYKIVSITDVPMPLAQYDHRQLTLENVNQSTGAGLGTFPTLPVVGNIVLSDSYGTFFQSWGDASGYDFNIWNVEIQGPTITMRRDRPADVEQGYGGFIASRFSIEDGRSGENSACVAHTVDKLADLPPASLDGHVVRVVGKESEDVDDVWMKFSSDRQGAVGYGVWREALQPGVAVGYDLSTMPVALVPSASGFVINPLNNDTVDGIILDRWYSREVGNDTLNPPPVFVNKRIKDMSTFNNRLAILVDDGISLSRTRDEFHFWSKTTRTSLDTDPIHLAAPGNELPQLHTMHDHERHLVLIGNNNQYAINGVQNLTPERANVFQTTSLDTVPGVRAVAAGRVLYLPYTSGNYSGLREYYTGKTQGSNDAYDITSHVNNYLDKGIKALAVDSQKSILYSAPAVSAAADSDGELFLYQYLWSDGERSIQAWHKWLVPFQTIDIRVSGTTLILLGWSSQDGLIIYKMNTNTREELINDKYHYLDATYQATVGAGGVVDITGWKHPLVNAVPTDLGAVLVSGQYDGMGLQIGSYTYGASLTLKGAGPVEGETVLLGVRYKSSYTPTRPVVKDEAGQPVQTGHLVVGTLKAQMFETGAFDSTVSSEYRDDSVQRYSARIVGSGNNLVGAPAIESAIFTTSVREDARRSTVTYSTDEHTAMTFQSIEWTGSYNKQGRRM